MDLPQWACWILGIYLITSAILFIIFVPVFVTSYRNISENAGSLRKIRNSSAIRAVDCAVTSLFAPLIWLIASVVFTLLLLLFAISLLITTPITKFFERA